MKKENEWERKEEREIKGTGEEENRGKEGEEGEKGGGEGK